MKYNCCLLNSRYPQSNPDQGDHPMQIGDKVKTIHGNVETVMNVEEARITTFESFSNTLDF